MGNKLHGLGLDDIARHQASEAAQARIATANATVATAQAMGQVLQGLSALYTLLARQEACLEYIGEMIRFSLPDAHPDFDTWLDRKQAEAVAEAEAAAQEALDADGNVTVEGQPSGLSAAEQEEWNALAEANSRAAEELLADPDAAVEVRGSIITPDFVKNRERTDA